MLIYVWSNDYSDTTLSTENDKTEHRIKGISPHIQDLTRAVVSCEIYESSLWRVSYTSYEMTTSVRFCLSYGPSKWDFIALRMIIISIWKCIVDTDVVNDVKDMRQSVITRVVIRFLWNDVIHWITATSCDKLYYACNSWSKQCISNTGIRTKEKMIGIVKWLYWLPCTCIYKYSMKTYHVSNCVGGRTSIFCKARNQYLCHAPCKSFIILISTEPRKGHFFSNIYQKRNRNKKN